MTFFKEFGPKSSQGHKIILKYSNELFSVKKIFFFLRHGKFLLPFISDQITTTEVASVL